MTPMPLPMALLCMTRWKSTWRKSISAFARIGFTWPFRSISVWIVPLPTAKSSGSSLMLPLLRAAIAFPNATPREPRRPSP